MIYWTLKSVPELAPLTRKQRLKVHRHCLHHHFWNARANTWIVTAFLGSVFTMTIVTAKGATILESFGLPVILWTRFALGLLGAIAGSCVLSLIAIPILRPHYREFIAKEGHRD